jgi:hypothetical protein
VIWLIQVGIAAIIFLIGILLAGNIGGGWVTVLVFAAPAFASLIFVRRSDTDPFQIQDVGCKLV